MSNKHKNGTENQKRIKNEQHSNAEETSCDWGKNSRWSSNQKSEMTQLKWETLDYADTMIGSKLAALRWYRGGTVDHFLEMSSMLTKMKYYELWVKEVWTQHLSIYHHINSLSNHTLNTIWRSDNSTLKLQP